MRKLRKGKEKEKEKGKKKYVQQGRLGCE